MEGEKRPHLPRPCFNPHSPYLHTMIPAKVCYANKFISCPHLSCRSVPLNKSGNRERQEKTNFSRPSFQDDFTLKNRYIVAKRTKKIGSLGSGVWRQGFSSLGTCHHVIYPFLNFLYTSDDAIKRDTGYSVSRSMPMRSTTLAQVRKERSAIEQWLPTSHTGVSSFKGSRRSVFSSIR